MIINGMTSLYPLKFKPILKKRVWGGDYLGKYFGKDTTEGNTIGESWEISGVEDNISLVTNGFLEGNNLEEVIEVYMGDLVGDEIYEEFANEFPLLIKLIDAREVLSIQVHPDNKLAKERHHAYGKTEMWYILSKEDESKIYTGFRDGVNRESYLKAIEEGNLPELLNAVDPEEGDVFYIPAGRVHAIGKGIVLAEIQQTSDITYRIYDWERTGLDGKPREIHTDLSVDAIDFKTPEYYKTRPVTEINQAINIADFEFFTTNLLRISIETERDYTLTESFVILLCTEGKAKIRWYEGEEDLQKGETILIPAIMDSISVLPEEECSILEIFITK